MKKLSKNGFSVIEVVLVIAVIAAVGGIGYYAYARMNSNSSKAHASGWTTLATRLPSNATSTLSNFSAQACKILHRIGDEEVSNGTSYTVKINLVNTNTTFRRTAVGVIAKLGSTSYTPTNYDNWYVGAYQGISVEANATKPKQLIVLSEQDATNAHTNYQIYNPARYSVDGINIDPSYLASC